ncbi:MAG: hypothetical protein GY861_13910 [bacterium]|nr:hypothetical protein [bacterium]
MPNETLTKALELAEAEYKLLPYKKRFIPIEEIARDPKRYGFGFDARESKARQGEFIADKRKIVAAILANRGGKTEAGAIKFLKTCLSKKGRAWSLCPSYDLQKAGTQEKILDYLKPEQIKRKTYATGTALKEIELINGTLIEFKTYEQGREKLQSAKLMVAWCDEEPSEEIYKEVLTRLVDLAGQMILTFTPLKGFTWSYTQVFNASSKNVGVYLWGMADNPFIPLSEIDMLKDNLTWKQAQMRLYGKYMGAESAVWQVFDRRIHINTDPMYDPSMPVHITVDFGVVTSAVLFGQHQKILTGKTPKERFVIIDAMEMHDTGYATMMRLIFQRISQRGYQMGDWYCDPAGRQRQQGSKTGTSLLELIKAEFGVQFSYIKKLSIEESIEMVASYMMNANGEARLFLDGEVMVDKNNNTLAQRIEGYVRDDDTHKPIDDDVVTHLTDCLRYFIMNRVRGGLRGRFKQH